MKAKTTATLCLKTSGEVIGEIANEDGELVSARHFGVMTDDEFQKCLTLIERVCTGGVRPISVELTSRLLSLCKSRSARQTPSEGH